MKVYLHFIFYVIKNKIYNIFTTNKKTNQEIIQNYMQCFFLAKEALQEDFKNKVYWIAGAGITLLLVVQYLTTIYSNIKK